MHNQPAAGGGRWIEVSPERLERWLAGFDDRHGVTGTRYGRGTVTLAAADGALAECHVPFPPLPQSAGEWEGLRAGSLLSHVVRERTVGVLLVRLGGHAAGVFQGTRLAASKVGSRPVHGRNKAGGQSQRRFQRRREEQARQANRVAADVAARMLLPWLDELEAVVCGGDRRAVESVHADTRLAPLFTLVTERFLTVPDPKLSVLRETPEQFRVVRIRLVEPE